MAKLDKIMAKVAANHPDWSQARVQKRAQTRLANQQVNKAVKSDLNVPSSDPMAQGAMGLFQNIMDIGGGANGSLDSILSKIGGGGSYTPVNYRPVGGVRDIGSDAVNINLGGLRNALTENANYALGQNLGALDARVAQGGLPGSSRHGIAQANTIADSDRNLQSTLAQANYQAYDADAARRLAAAQSNQSGDIATMNANAGLQGQAMGANAQLAAAAMNDATNRIGVAGNIANNQSNIALQRNQMLLNALGNAYDRDMGYRALNNQAMVDLTGMQYGLMNNQQDRALQYNMFGDNLDFQRQNLLYGMANAKNDTMNQGIYNTGNMQGAGAGALNSWGSLGDLGNLAGLIAPILTGNTSGYGTGWSRGNSSAFGMEGGGGVGGSGGGSSKGNIGGGWSSTVICTHMYRNGYIDEDTYNHDRGFGALIRMCDPNIYRGYIVWAAPYVRLMERHPVLTKITAPFAKAWAKHMKYLFTGKDDSLLGKVIMKVGMPVCRFIGKNFNADEVCHGF